MKEFGESCDGVGNDDDDDAAQPCYGGGGGGATGGRWLGKVGVVKLVRRERLVLWCYPIRIFAYVMLANQRSYK